MSCPVCTRPLDGEMPVHAACLPAGLARDAALALVELLAIVATPLVLVWAA